MNELHRKLGGVLAQDARFLKRHGFLDYSLLLAIEENDQVNVNLERL